MESRQDTQCGSLALDRPFWFRKTTRTCAGGTPEALRSHKSLVAISTLKLKLQSKAGEGGSLFCVTSIISEEWVPSAI